MMGKNNKSLKITSQDTWEGNKNPSWKAVSSLRVPAPCPGVQRSLGTALGPTFITQMLSPEHTAGAEQDPSDHTCGAGTAAELFWIILNYLSPDFSALNHCLTWFIFNIWTEHRWEQAGTSDSTELCPSIAEPHSHTPVSPQSSWRGCFLPAAALRSCAVPAGRF